MEATLKFGAVATQVGVCLETLHRWRQKGRRGRDGVLVRLQAVRIGGRWYTTESAWRRFIAETQPRSTVVVPPRPKRLDRATVATLEAFGLRVPPMGETA